MMKVLYGNRAFVAASTWKDVVVVKEVPLAVIVEDRLVVCGNLEKVEYNAAISKRPQWAFAC